MIYDLIIIGGGPAGMMAAARASERGARVIVLEKNKNLGLKFLATGNGRCNITNVSADNKQTIGVYGKNSKFLFSAFSRFGVENTLNFFSNLGIATKVEDRGRVFPESNRAVDVRSALIEYLKKNKVEIMYEAVVKKIAAKNQKIEKVILENKKEFFGKNFIMATGGKSYPETGSSGDGYDWLKKLGHTINTPRPALTPIVVKEKIIKQIEGLSFANIGVSVYQNKKNIAGCSGDIIFTADGVSGPAIIDLSGRIGALLPTPVTLQIDFRPEIGKADFEKKMQSDFHGGNNKIIKNYLQSIIPPRLVSIVLEITSINEQKQINVISREERVALVSALKEFSLGVKGLKGFDRAMITAGGVEIKEVDPRSMRSRFYSNLFLVGEILDLDGPTGGYNLQICWSTGYAAGDSIEI